MEIQKLGISYQFERSGQLPLDNSFKFNTYTDVKNWWLNVGNFYVSLIISIGNTLYYFYTLPESADTALDNDLENHLRKLINEVDLAENQIDTTEIDNARDLAINAAKDALNTSIDNINTSLNIYAANTDASILNILDLIDADTLGKIDTIELRIDNVAALLEDSNLDMLSTLDTSIKDLISITNKHDTSLGKIDSSLKNLTSNYNTTINNINSSLNSLKSLIESYNDDNIGASGTGIHSEIFNDYVNNTATGQYAHAEGSYTKANGNYAFAGGYNSQALDDYSFAFGNEAKSEKQMSVAIGYKAKATARYSIALGTLVTAAGQNSIAAGYYASTTNQGEIALGINNYTEADLTLFTIGNSDPANAKRNAITVTNRDTNNVYIHGIGNYTGANPYAAENIKSLLQVITDLYDLNSTAENHINSSIIDLSTYIHSYKYLTANSSTNDAYDTSALSLKGGKLLHTYISNVNSSLIDLSTNIYRKESEDVFNIFNKIFDVSTDVSSNVERIDTSIVMLNTSVNKLEVSTNIIERYIEHAIDPSIRYIKDHDIRIDSSVQILNTSVFNNNTSIILIRSHINKVDSSILKLNTSVYNIETNVYDISTAMEQIIFTAEDLHAVQYVELPLSEKQKSNARENINAVSKDDYDKAVNEINILYELDKVKVKHLFIDETAYTLLTTYLANVIYMVVPNNSMITVPKPPNRTINIDNVPENGVTLLPTIDYSVSGEGGSELGTYKFIVSLKAGRRWDDLTIDPIIVTYTITGDAVYTWQFGDSLPIVLL